MIRHPKYNRGNMYLSGGMQFKKGKGSTWRINASEKLRNMGYFPLDICELDRAYAAEHGDLFYAYQKEFSHEELVQFKSNIRKHFVYTDLELVDKDSDAIIVLWDEAAQLGGGTHNEISHAYERDIPIFLVAAVPREKIPGWIVAQSTKIFRSFDSLWKYLEDLPHGILCRDIYGNHAAGNQYLCSLCGDPFTKQKHHFVSKVSPLYCNDCVDNVEKTFEQHKDRYEFFAEYLANQSLEEMKKDG